MHFSKTSSDRITVICLKSKASIIRTQRSVGFLVSQVISVVSRHPDLQKISFIGHSLGGLIARYAIAVLYQHNRIPKHGEENGEEDGDEPHRSSLAEKPRGDIAGLEPVNFITFATPHLGSRGHKQVKIMLC